MVRNGVAVWMLWFMVVVMVVLRAEGKAPELHRVGGTKGWTQNINYTNWALHETFYVGDWLCILSLSPLNLFFLVAKLPSLNFSIALYTYIVYIYN